MITKTVIGNKEQTIRAGCEDKFEGWPCNYPDCTCSSENKKEMERWADQVLNPEYNGTY